MIKIRSLGFRNIRQVFHLLTAHGPEKTPQYRALRQMGAYYPVLYQLSHCFTSLQQFIPAIYVASSRGKVLGAIWLEQDGSKPNRRRIEKLVLDPEEFSYDVGSQLVNFAINRYGAEGVQTFLAHVDVDSPESLSLFKSCGFRKVARQHHFSHSNPGALAFTDEPASEVREATTSDRYKLKELHSDALAAETRICLEKTPEDFSLSLLQQVAGRSQGVFSKRWVVDDPVHDMLLAAAEITTGDYRHFELSLMISPAWKAGYESLLRFSVEQALKIGDGAQVKLRVYEADKEQLALVEKLGFERNAVVDILVKDYWIPLQDREPGLASPILIFERGKTSPA